jgi:lipoprotein-releasing system permease protein
MPFELQIALRYLTARRKQAFISLISGVSVLGVLVGVMALMIALGLLTGLQSEIRSKILGATAHVSIFKSRSGEGIETTAAVTRRCALPRRAGRRAGVLREGLISSRPARHVATHQGRSCRSERRP